MKKKVLSVLLAAAMTVSMLTGCGSKPDCFRRRRDTDRMVLGS